MFEINRVRWYIRLAHPHHSHLMRSDGSYALAACDYLEQTIYISEEVDKNKMKKVLCHEITHAAMFSYGVILTLEQEELLADLMATYGAEVIAITNKIFSRIKNNGNL